MIHEKNIACIADSASSVVGVAILALSVETGFELFSVLNSISINPRLVANAELAIQHIPDIALTADQVIRDALVAVGVCTRRER